MNTERMIPMNFVVVPGVKESDVLRANEYMERLNRDFEVFDEIIRVTDPKNELPREEIAAHLKRLKVNARVLWMLADCYHRGSVEFRNKAIAGAKARMENHIKPKKLEVYSYWEKWCKEPNLYKNKTTFDECMSDKTGMKQRTVAKWRKDFEK